ncbi:hypothetical protein GCM10022252_63890 [Streptosporangium oxazolinicum]|uniref:Uncharacterized protein n=1 Tax=Streptosporangium oxazolinicum TaxID=909287 RepID=A0ABP8BE20_9ACTN
MNRTKRMILIAGVGTALAGGLAVPVAAWATSPTPAPSSSATPGIASDAPEHGPRGGHGGRGDHREMAAQLAEILGLDKDKVTTALEEVRQEGRPDRPLKTPGQDAPRDEAKKAALGKQAEALAAKLGLTTDKVAAALETLHRQLGAKAEAALADRLKTAVTDGTLTQAESDAVLKAYRAGLLPGAPGRR